MNNFSSQIKSRVHIPVDGVRLTGELMVPESSSGLVIFSHGSGSSRLSPRNVLISEKLHQNGFATLLFDLLTPQEDQHYENRFNIDLLTERLIAVTEWVINEPRLKKLPLAYFGASTGAASALGAAAHFRNIIKAVVSRGGRPDLTTAELNDVAAPVLLIVGSLDDEVLDLNRQVLKQLNSESELGIIRGASHLFQEPGKLEEAANLAIQWFKKFVRGDKKAGSDKSSRSYTS